MKTWAVYRPLLVGSVALTVCLLVVTLLMTARSVGATLTPTNDAPLAKKPRTPSAVNEVLLPKSTAAYNGVITPATTVYAPWVLGGTSFLRVYNAGDVEATVRATFYDAGQSFVKESSLVAGAVDDIWPPGVIVTGTTMSAILTGSQPLVVTVNDFSRDRLRVTSYAAIPQGVSDTRLNLPHILFDYSGDSWPVIQNVGVMTAHVTIVYTDPNKLDRNWQDSQELAPGQVYVFDPSDASLPQGFQGFATVSSEQPLVAVVNTEETAYPPNTYVYRVPFPPARPGVDRPLYFPSLINQFENWDRSMIWLINAGATGVTFDLEIDGQVDQANQLIDSWDVGSYIQNNLASEWAGAGRVAEAQSLHGLVWLLGNFTGDSVAAYTAFSRGANTWYLPYTDEGAAFTTYVAVQNLSHAATVPVCLIYHDAEGETTTVEDAIPPSRMVRFAAPTGFVGGVVVEADQPVTAVAVIAGRLILDKAVYMPVAWRSD
jgi:hypothetical protein